MGHPWTWNTDLELGIVVVNHHVVTTREDDAIIVDVDYIVLHISLDTECMPEKEA